MYTVTHKIIIRNAANYSYAKVKSASTLNEVFRCIPLHKGNISKKHQVFEVSDEGCSFEFTIILSQSEFYVVFQSMGTRVYDYIHSDEAIEFIKIMASLMEYDSFEEDK